MDIFERLLNLSPDGGSGALEAIYVVSALLAMGIITCRRRIASLFQAMTRAGRDGRR